MRHYKDLLENKANSNNDIQKQTPDFYIHIQTQTALMVLLEEK